MYQPHFLLASHFVVTVFDLSPEHFVAPSHLVLVEHLLSASVVPFFVQPLKASRAKPMSALIMKFFISVSFCFFDSCSIIYYLCKVCVVCCTQSAQMIGIIRKNQGKEWAMKRRKFLILGSVLGLSSYMQAKGVSDFEKAFKRIAPTLSAVQEHLFPEGGKLPSARSMKVTQFLFETMMHQSFDKDIKAFVIEGAKELEKREKGRFTAMAEAEKEKALRAYEETHYGRNWLSHIMTLTMEGLFSDPIYGSNIDEAGWKAISSYGALPRPTTRYIEV